MDSIKSQHHPQQGSQAEAQDELSDEPPHRNPPQSRPHWSSLSKLLAVALAFFLLAQPITCAISTSDGIHSANPAGIPPLDRRTHRHGVTKGLNQQSNTPSAISILLIPVLVLASGLFAGLTIGYMSLDSTQLTVLSKSGTPAQRILAQKVAPLRKNGHMLLITLLIANMIANETLPIVSEKALGGGIQAVIISTVLVIIFSEIIPQTVCATHALRIGAACARPVQMLVYLFYPIVWPISWLLTKLLGEHAGMIYRPAELKELINLHARQSNHGGDLAADVVTIIGSAIDLQERVVEESMTALDNCFMLDIDTQLNYETMSDILASGHSRIPVYENIIVASGSSRRIVGALLTKQLILIDPEDGVLLREFPLNPLPHVASDMPLLNILNSFQEGRSHLAVVCPSINTLANVDLGPAVVDAKPAMSKSPWWRFMCKKSTDGPHESDNESRNLDGFTTSVAVQSSKRLLTDQPMGIISLEDVLEALLNEPIYDETDLDEHGHMAVPPYVPPEAFAALRKPSSYSIPSVLYDSKPPHQLTCGALQIETQVILPSASATQPNKTKDLHSYDFESPEFSPSGPTRDLKLFASLSSATCDYAGAGSPGPFVGQPALASNAAANARSTGHSLAEAKLHSHFSSSTRSSSTPDRKSRVLSSEDFLLGPMGGPICQPDGHPSSTGVPAPVFGFPRKNGAEMAHYSILDGPLVSPAHDDQHVGASLHRSAHGPPVEDSK